MLKDNSDWKEIEDFTQKEKSDTIEKYGFDIYHEFERKTSKEMLSKRKNIKKL